MGITLNGPLGDDRLELSAPPPEDDVLGQARHVGAVARIRIHDYKDDAVFFLKPEDVAALLGELGRIGGMPLSDPDVRRRAEELVQLGEAWLAISFQATSPSGRQLDAGILMSAFTHFLRALVAGRAPQKLMGLDAPQHWYALDEPRENPPTWSQR